MRSEKRRKTDVSRASLTASGFTATGTSGGLTGSQINVKHRHAFPFPSSVVLLILSSSSSSGASVPRLSPAFVEVERVLPDEVGPGDVKEGRLCEEENLSRHTVLHDVTGGDGEESHIGGDEEAEEEDESEVERQRRSGRRKLVHLHRRRYPEKPSVS